MYLKVILMLGVIVMVTADESKFADDLSVASKEAVMDSKYLISDFEHGAVDKEMHKGKFLGKIKNHDESGEVVYPEFLLKLLKRETGEEFKKEQFSEEDLKAALLYITKLLESKIGGALLKQEEFYKGVDHTAVDVSKMFKTKPEDLHAHGDLLHVNKEEKSVMDSVDHFKDGDTGLFKAMAELKAEKSLVPPFGTPFPDFLKSALHGEKAIGEDKYLAILKSLEGIKADDLLPKEKLMAAKGLSKEHFLKDDLDEEAFKEHKVLHEKAVDHKKDFIFDEILKGEEAHAYGEDLGAKESTEFDEEIFPHSLLHEAKTDLDALAKKDLSSEGIFKEKGLNIDKAKINLSKKEEITGKDLKIGETKDEGFKLESTHAYDKAKEQAHKDALIPFSEEGKDGVLKTILTNTKTEVKKMPETKIYGEETLKKEKSLVDYEDLYKKLLEKHDIAKEISHGIKKDEEVSKDTKVDHGIKTGEDISKGILHGIKIDEGISKGTHIHHGIKLDEGIAKGILHGIKTDEDTSKDIHHGMNVNKGISKEIHHGIKLDEGIAKGIQHGIKSDEDISKGIHHEIKTDEGISKKIHHGIKMDEEFTKGIKAAEEQFIHSIEKHIPLLLKKKALELLNHILHMKKCHLVSMKPGELLSVVNCISRSKDPILCEKFAMCEKKMPPQVILALEMCQKEVIPEKALRCSKYEPLYPSPDVPLKIFQCIVKNTRELLPEEKKQMIAFEECARQVKAESCGRIPWG